MIGIVSISQQALNHPTSMTDVALKVSNGILGFGRAVTAFSLGAAVQEILVAGERSVEIRSLGFAAAIAIVLNRSLSLIQNKINSYSNTLKA